MIFDSLIGRGLTIALICMTIFSGVQTMRISSLKGNLEKKTAELVQCKTSLDAEKANREEERTTDRQLATGQAAFCRRERDLAIIAGQSIQGIVNGKNNDGSSRGDIVTADELRDIISEKKPADDSR